MDSVSKEKRSWNMSRIKSENTKPEKKLRSWLFKEGYRYRLHKKELPGSPDIVLKKYKTVIFVNGCYWHRHENCKLAYNPKSNIEFWQKKFKENVSRDKKNYKKIKQLGWKVIICWECQIKNNFDVVKEKIEKIFKN